MRPWVRGQGFDFLDCATHHDARYDHAVPSRVSDASFFVLLAYYEMTKRDTKKM